MSVLDIVASEMEKINVPYEFMEWTGSIQYPYWVGEYSEISTYTEDGYKECTVILTGTTKGSWMELEETRAKIEEHFPGPHGLRIAADDGAVVIHYDNSFPVHTGEADLKRLQINMQVKQWKGLN